MSKSHLTPPLPPAELAKCPVCGHRVEGVGLTDTRAEPCRCELTREQYDELVGAKPAPCQEVLRQVAALRLIAGIHGVNHQCVPIPGLIGWTEQPCETMRVLASMWAGHPDYDTTWEQR